MARDITRLLKKGIAHLEAGGTVEEYVGQEEARQLSSAEREELGTLLETAAGLLQLRQVAIPAPKAKAANRARFLSEAVHLQAERQRLRARWPLAPLIALRGWRRAPAQVWRGLLGAALAVALLLAISSVVNAAAGSLPGSPLYPLKLAVENTRLFLTPSRAARAQLYMRFANERSAELARLATMGRPVDEAVVSRMAEQLQGAVQAAESAGGEVGRELLEQVIETSSVQQEVLRQVSTQAPPEAQAVLHAGASIAEQASRQAQEVLQNLPTPTPMPTLTSTSPPAPTLPPVIVPVAKATPSYTPEPATPKPVETLSATPLAPTDTPTLPATPSTTLTQTLEPTGTPSVTASVTPEPTASATPEPTPSPQAVFRLTNTDNPDPVPATYRIYYDICVLNDGEVPLTGVVITATWSPIECVYLPPDNPTHKIWNVGTVNPHKQYCVRLTLNTFSICGGYIVTNEAVMTCDQGTARAVQTTRIGPMPSATASMTVTPAPTPTWTWTPSPAPTLTLTPTPSLTLTLELTPTFTPPEGG